MRISWHLQIGIHAGHGIWEVGAAVKEYAVYKGDELLGVGTAEELAEKFGVRPRTIKNWSCPSFQKRGTGERGGNKIAILLEDDDDDDQ